MIKSKHLLIMIFLLIIQNISFPQNVVPSLSNTLRYGNGERLYGQLGVKQKYFENLTDFRLSLPENFVIGFRLLYDEPPEIGPRFKGIKRRFIEYSNNGFYLRAGNSSTLFGRGLAFNLFENRGIAYDTWMDGIKSSYQNDLFKATIVGGDIDFRDSVTFVRNEKYKIRGANIEVYPLDQLTVGASFINAEGVIPQGQQGANIPAKNINADIPEFYISLNVKNISAYIDWSQKNTDVITDDTKSKGWGMYSSVSYLGDGFGVTLDYKNYKFDVRDPYGRTDYASPTRMLPFQNPPIVQREYSFTLLTRPLHIVDFNDEVGLQVEVFYSLNENTTITFNTSFSSRHYKYDLQPDFTFREVKRSASFLPSFSKEYFPYYEVYAKAEHYFDDATQLTTALALRNETFYNEFSKDKSSTITRSIVFPVQFQHNFNENYSATVESEFEKVKISSPGNKSDFINQLILLKGIFYSKLTFDIRYEFTTSDNDPTGKKSWMIGEAGYRITPSNILTFSYGSEKGGQVCSNGVCRYILPFSGFRFSLQTQI